MTIASRRVLHPIADLMGEFAMIHKNKIFVDHDYQRKLKPTNVDTYARDFSWVAFGAISVALREDGEWYVSDGQHRLRAAQAREEIKEVPCIVFDFDGNIEKEANAFLVANTARKPMTAVARFKALRMTGNNAARVVDELVTRSGREIVEGSSSPHHVSCVNVLLHCAKEDELTLRRVWPLIDEFMTGKRINQFPVQAIWQLERKLLNADSLIEKKWKQRIMDVGPEALQKAIQETAAFLYKGRGFSVCAVALANLLNKGRRITLEHSIDLKKATT